MSSQSAAGRRRSNIRQYSVEDQALNMISKEAEARLAAKRAARAEARDIRMKEMEKQHKNSEEKQDKIYELTNDHAAAKMRQQVGSSRRGSSESNDSGADGRDIDLKAEVRELEDKYKAAMMTSAQLDNEKQSLVYQVELLKDQLEEQDEGYTELQREYKDKCREYELQKRDLKSKEHELNILKQQLELKDRLIQESGFVIMSNDSGEPVLEKQSSSLSATASENPLPTGDVLVSPETKEFLEKAGDGTLGTPIPSNPTTNLSVVSSHMNENNCDDVEQITPSSSPDNVILGEKVDMLDSQLRIVSGAGDFDLNDNVVMASNHDLHASDNVVTHHDNKHVVLVVDGKNDEQSQMSESQNPKSSLAVRSKLESDDGDEFYDAISTPIPGTVKGSTDGSSVDGPSFKFDEGFDGKISEGDPISLPLNDVTMSESFTDEIVSTECKLVKGSSVDCDHELPSENEENVLVDDFSCGQNQPESEKCDLMNAGGAQNEMQTEAGNQGDGDELFGMVCNLNDDRTGGVSDVKERCDDEASLLKDEGTEQVNRQTDVNNEGVSDVEGSCNEDASLLKDKGAEQVDTLTDENNEVASDVKDDGNEEVTSLIEESVEVIGVKDEWNEEVCLLKDENIEEVCISKDECTDQVTILNDGSPEGINGLKCESSELVSILKDESTEAGHILRDVSSDEVTGVKAETTEVDNVPRDETSDDVNIIRSESTIAVSCEDESTGGVILLKGENAEKVNELNEKSSEGVELKDECLEEVGIMKDDGTEELSVRGDGIEANNDEAWGGNVLDKGEISPSKETSIIKEKTNVDMDKDGSEIQHSETDMKGSTLGDSKHEVQAKNVEISEQAGCDEQAPSLGRNFSESSDAAVLDDYDLEDIMEGLEADNDEGQRRSSVCIDQSKEISVEDEEKTKILPLLAESTVQKNDSEIATESDNFGDIQGACSPIVVEDELENETKLTPGEEETKGECEKKQIGKSESHSSLEPEDLEGALDKKMEKKVKKKSKKFKLFKKVFS